MLQLFCLILFLEENEALKKEVEKIRSLVFSLKLTLN